MGGAADRAPVGHGDFVLIQQALFSFSARFHNPINAQLVDALKLLDRFKQLLVGIRVHPMLGFRVVPVQLQGLLGRPDIIGICIVTFPDGLF